jgi:hypothetical protein
VHTGLLEGTAALGTPEEEGNAQGEKKRYQREAASHVLGRWAPQSSGQTVLIALRTGGWGISTQHGKLGNQNTHL